MLRPLGPVVAVLLGLGCTAVPDDPCPPGSLRLECRQRCQRDSDCVAPAVCDPLTHRCQARAIACDPPGSQVPDGDAEDAPDAGAPAACPEHKECDLLTRTCIPVPGAPCQRSEDCRPGEVCSDGSCMPDAEAQACLRDAECPPGQICRLTLDPMGQLRAVCGPPLGPSPPGARCVDGRECQSGICLLSGVCFGGCTPQTVHTDCDPAEEQVCGQVVLSTADGRSHIRATCTPKLRPCQRDRDCADTGGACSITTDPLDPTRLITACTMPRGRARAGGPCRQDEDCPSGLCLSTYCFAACVNATDCRPGFACRAESYVLGDTQGSIKTCTPARMCTTRFSCPAPDETCAPQPDAAGTGLALVCTPGLGAQTGEACRHGGDCMSGICLVPGLCAGGCNADGDCPRGPQGQVELCRPARLEVAGVEGTVKVCQIPPPACQRDADCSQPGHICRPYLSLDNPLLIRPGCGPAPNPGQGQTGAPCNLSAECRSNYCMRSTSPPVCYGICRSDADCPAGQRCYAESVHFLTSGTSGTISATYDATSACAPNVGSRRPCSGDGSAMDCPAGEVCVPVPDAQQVAWAKRCLRPVGPGRGGATCADNKECQSGRCTLIGGTRRCVGLCAVGGAAVCAPGTSCRAGTLGLRTGYAPPLTYCQ
ncbi:MAG: hypothetical protein NZ890_03385 [Myxococcota bacterium]|nr:hypothetical protein [Myxococcota bacterium]